MTRKNMTQIEGTVRFRYSKEPDDLAAVVRDCVWLVSCGDELVIPHVRLRDFKVLAVETHDGVASVLFEANARLGWSAAVPLGGAAVTAIWEACNYRFGNGELNGVSLLPLEMAGVRTGGGSVGDLSTDKLLDDMMAAAERFNQVRFGWLETDLFHRYVSSIRTEEEVLAKMPEPVRRRYLDNRATLFRWMKPKQEPDQP
jgi:hypothetical protein